jgi:diphthine methyl ester synthase
LCCIFHSGIVEGNRSLQARFFCRRLNLEKKMVLYLIGLGLGDERDITVRGLEAIKTCDRVYLEAYTSVLCVDAARLSAYYGKSVEVADRELVEQGADRFIEESRTMNVAFLVVGDPYGATTHSDLWLRAKQANADVEVVHNASIMNAIGCTGLQLYRFGEAVSIVFFSETWRPTSFYDKIASNRRAGLHTLCLLDIKVKEQSIENMCRGRKIYEPPRYMSVNTAVEQLIEAAQRVADERGVEPAYTPETMAVGVARVGQADQLIVSGTLEQLRTVDFGAPLHSLVLAGELHHIERDHIKVFDVSHVNQSNESENESESGEAASSETATDSETETTL